MKRNRPCGTAIPRTLSSCKSRLFVELCTIDNINKYRFFVPVPSLLVISCYTMKRNRPFGLPLCSGDTLRALLSPRKHSVSYGPRFRTHCQAENLDVSATHLSLSRRYSKGLDFVELFTVDNIQQNKTLPLISILASNLSIEHSQSRSEKRYQHSSI